MKRLCVSAALVAALVGTAASGEPSSTAPPAITEPDWLERPSGELLSFHYPKLALALEIEGRTRISCTVTEKGRLTNCKVLDETPAELGFGAAAMAMTGTFRMRPKTVDGKAVAGGTADIPLRFSLPLVEPEPPTAVAPEALALALRIVDARQLEATFRESAAEHLIELESDISASTPEEARQAAAEALRQSIADQIGSVRPSAARALARTLTVTELSALAAFMESASGKVLRDQDLNATIVARVESDLQHTLMEEIRRDLCKRRACVATEAELKVVAAPAKPGVLDPKMWRATPTATRIGSAVPMPAMVGGVAGAVRLNCATKADGYLEACRATAEAPAGWGFGAAAARLSRAYRLESSLQAGVPVTVRIDFPAAPNPFPAAAPRATRADRSQSLAETLVDELDLFPGESLQALANAGGAKRPEGVDPAVFGDVIAAFRVGVDRTLAKAQSVVAAGISAEYTETELADAVAFHTSRIGRSLHAKQAVMDAETGSALKRVAAAIASEARDEFCATRDCIQAAPEPQPTAASPDPSTRNP